MPPKKSSTNQPRLGFFRTLKASFYSPEFYGGLDKQTGGRAFWFFVRITALYLGLVAIMLGVAWANNDAFRWEKLADALVDVYPEELVVTFQDGKASVNVEEPFFIDFPEVWMSIIQPDAAAGEQKDGPEEAAPHLLVIDTKTPFSVPVFREYDTVAWLAEDSLYYLGQEDGEVRGVELGKVKNMEFTRASMEELGEKTVTAVQKMFPAILSAVAVLVFLFFVAWELIYLLVLAVLIAVMRSMLNLPAEFGLSYKTGLFALSYAYAAMLASMGLNLFTPWDFGGFPFMITLIVLAGVGLNLKNVNRP